MAYVSAELGSSGSGGFSIRRLVREELRFMQWEN